MIRTLRKRHLQIWTAWAVLLPVGIIAAWLAVPQQPVQSLLQPAAGNVLPVILHTTDKQDYTVALRGNADGTQLQLEWINKNVLTFPTATIYQTNNLQGDIATGSLIGRIEARGSYYFPVRRDTSNIYHFVLYDFIHQQVIDTINF